MSVMIGGSVIKTSKNNFYDIKRIDEVDQATMKIPAKPLQERYN